MARMNPKEIERRLGLAYAQTLKESTTPGAGSVYKDCQDVIQSSLAVMEHYNKISLGMKNLMGKGKQLITPKYNVPT